MAKKKGAEEPVLPYSGTVKVNASFMIDPDLLKDAKEYCYLNRDSFSSWVERLVREAIIPQVPKIKASIEAAGHSNVKKSKVISSPKPKTTKKK